MEVRVTSLGSSGTWNRIKSSGVTATLCRILRTIPEKWLALGQAKTGPRAKDAPRRPKGPSYPLGRKDKFRIGFLHFRLLIDSTFTLSISHGTQKADRENCSV
jgi:hypothetical protein